MRSSVNLCLLLVSFAVGLSLCELTLRLFYPKYRGLAEARSRSDDLRIWAREANARSWWIHPDTRSRHAVHHNNFALRQNRNFSAADFTSATNIGVFGDSFVENLDMAAPYSFTEPLDWLLNQGRKRFNVLNFGVAGYGPGQSFLHYEHFRHAEDLDYVFFVYCGFNDLEDIHERGLFHLDGAGRLARNEVMQPSWWTRFISGLHASYLVLDVSGRLHNNINRELRRASWDRRGSDMDIENSLAVLGHLMRRWKRLVERNGGKFFIVLLPFGPVDLRFTTLLGEEGLEVIDLDDCFWGHDNDHRRRQWGWRLGFPRSPYRFRNNFHWNEDGNRLAAVCIYRFLEDELRFPNLSEYGLREALHQYYSAFGGWMPPGSPDGGGSMGAAAGIRKKYQAAVDLDWALFKNRVKTLMQTAEKQIIRSDIDVYLDGKRELVYVKEDCSKADTLARLYLEISSVDEPGFHEDINRAYFHFWNDKRFWMIDEKLCVARRFLPDSPVAHVSSVLFGEGNTIDWQGEAFLDRRAFRKMLKRLGKDIAPENLAIRSDFDVYINGRRLTYVTSVCSQSGPRFFLHIVPVDARDIPEERAKHGFANMDFIRTGVQTDKFGCVISVSQKIRKRLIL